MCGWVARSQGGTPTAAEFKGAVAGLAGAGECVGEGAGVGQGEGEGGGGGEGVDAVGLGRIVAVYHHPSISYQICKHIRGLFVF
jgi:hypothetical protein